MQGHSGFSFECIQRTDCKCFGPPVAIRIGQSSSIDAPTLLFTAKSTNTAHNIPFSYTDHCMPKKVYYKIKLQRSNATKSLQEIFVPPLWQPPSTTYCHRIVTRPHTTSSSGACVYFFNLYNFLTFKDSSVHCFAQFRIATFWTITVCCYLQICVHVHAARFGDVWNSFPGFAWCCCAVFGT